MSKAICLTFRSIIEGKACPCWIQLPSEKTVFPSKIGRGGAGVMQSASKSRPPEWSKVISPLTTGYLTLIPMSENSQHLLPEWICFCLFWHTACSDSFLQLSDTRIALESQNKRSERETLQVQINILSSRNESLQLSAYLHILPLFAFLESLLAPFLLLFSCLLTFLCSQFLTWQITLMPKSSTLGMPKGKEGKGEPVS